MDPRKASATALATSLMRAIHTRADPAPIIDDPWGDRLVPAAALQAFHARALAEMAPAVPPPNATPADVVAAAMKASPAYTAVIVRTRFAEDALHAAVARGATQYVLVGAGFDSYALRVPPAARHLAIFEVDHPATQTLKQAQLRACGAAPAAHVHFVSADLAAETLDAALGRSAFDRSAPSFFSWLGVTMYLPREANLNALRAIAACAARGSELVFTYLDQAGFENRGQAASAAAHQLAATVSSLGEPFLSGFHPHELASDLASCGLELLEDCSDQALAARYDPEGRNRLEGSGGSHVARARVRG